MDGVSTGKHSRKALTVLLSLFFIAAGTLHFVKTRMFVSVVPPYIPFPETMVYLSGVLEIAGGAGILLARTARIAGYALILLLIAVFPANVHMAIHSEKFAFISPVILWLRLPLQPLIMTWVWYCAIKK